MNKCILTCATVITILAIAVSPALAKKKRKTRAKAPAGASGRAGIPERTGSPYLGALVLNADTGEVAMEENADAECYPASIIKLMDLLVLQEKIERKGLDPADQIKITAEASKIGGSQVYLKENESFPVEELLYALMIQSANDAATALAIHAAGSTDGFVKMMQERANALGMKNTKFHSVHGLPPGKDQEPDISTPRDLSILAREILKHPDIIKYTSAAVRGFRNNTMEMRNHNKLLGSFDGCDGLKTGYFKLGGYSIVATAKRGGNRYIAVVVGAEKKAVRDAKAKELLAKAFAAAPAKPAAPTPLATTSQPPAQSQKPQKPAQHISLVTKLMAVVITALVAWGIYCIFRRHGGPPEPPGVHYQLKK